VPGAPHHLEASKPDMGDEIQKKRCHFPLGPKRYAAVFPLLMNSGVFLLFSQYLALQESIKLNYQASTVVKMKGNYDFQLQPDKTDSFSFAVGVDCSVPQTK
jgi:hypothetical protein